MKRLFLILLIAATCQADPVYDRDIFDTQERRYYRSSLELGFSFGTAEGQLLYWDDANSVWTASDEAKLSWDDVNDILLVDTLNLNNALTVPYGGTGATSFTDGGILLGSGTSPITALGVASNGQIPIGDGATDPVLATITGSSGVTVTNGPGTITLDVNDTGVDHGGLTGLGDDDHIQYLLADGTRDLTGDWAISANSITLTLGTLTAEQLTSTDDLNVTDVGTFGHIQADNFTTDEVTNNTIFVGDDSGGSGTNSVYVGEHAGENDTSSYGAGVGNYVLQNNTGTNPVASGFSTAQDNTGNYLTSGGYAAAQRNKGHRLTVSGGFAAQNNLGDDASLYGYLSGQHNTENNLVGVGGNTGQWNTGENPTFAGGNAGRWNDSDNTTSVGYNSFNKWVDDTPAAETFDNTDIDDVNDRITITTHGFGATNSYTNLMYDVGTSSIPGLTDGTIYQWKIINANLIELRIGDITDAGSGTGHTFTPKVCYANSSAFGYDAEPDAANQVMLGDTNVTQVKSAGGIYLAGGTFTVGATGTLNASGDATTSGSPDSDSTTIQTGDGYDREIGDGDPGGDTGDYTNVTGGGGAGGGGNSGGDSGDWLGGSGDAGVGISAGSSTSGNATLETGTAHFSGFGSATTGNILLKTGDTIGGVGVAGDITLAPGIGSSEANNGEIIFELSGSESARFTTAGDFHVKDDYKIIMGDGSDVTAVYSSIANRLLIGTTVAETQWDTNANIFTILATSINLEADVTITGDQIFLNSSSGLPFGAFYGNNIAWTSVAFGGGGTFVIISDSDIIGGNQNLTTFQNEQELLIDIAGKYLVTWTISGECAGANKHIEIAPGINGTANAAGRNHFETGNANQEYAIAGTTILTLAATNTLSLMLTNVDDNTQVSVHHINLTAVHVGG